MTTAFDVAVVGGGIAGITAAYELAADSSVVLLEAEKALAYHTTGRSAAVFVESIGGPAIRALTRSSRSLLDGAADRFGTPPILSARGLLFVARDDQRGRLDALVQVLAAESASLRSIDLADAHALVPALDGGYVAAAAFEPEAQDIDVMALHHGYVRGFLERGGRIVRDARVRTLRRDGAAWLVGTERDAVQAGIVVNAAGAWADEVAALAGLAPVGVQPLRRTAAIAFGERTWDARAWPATLDADEQFYFLPQGGGGFLISPADETPSEPVDARPEEIDVARAIDCVNRATTLGLARVANAWAGLRSFAPDRAPVVGYDPRADGFFWLAGQGGYGIQISTALAEVAAALAAHSQPPAPIVAAGLDPEAISVTRLIRS
jgi:D-arginine dehydrogenase